MTTIYTTDRYRVSLAHPGVLLTRLEDSATVYLQPGDEADGFIAALDDDEAVDITCDQYAELFFVFDTANHTVYTGVISNEGHTS